MRMERLRRVVIWLEDMVRSMSGLIRTPEHALVPARITETSERDLSERRKLLARTRPRLPPLQ